jgi:succinyl-CoA synthetase alpha subunit
MNPLGRLPAIVSPNNNKDAARRIAVARAIWNATRNAHGTPVVAYLAGRGQQTSLRRHRCAGRHAAGTGRPAPKCRL